MYEKVKAYVIKHGMLEYSDCVIAGVSGGADSICLLCMLIELQEEYGLKIIVVHVNHLLRGEEAKADELYVKRFCSSYNIPVYVSCQDVKSLAKERGLSQEEAGRDARRAVFKEAADKYGADKIALAHHMDDNVETLFLNIARGTGLKGLGGIQPVNGLYIRPLLGVKREEIEEYLRKKGIRYCIDRTNYSDTYTRNRIRNHVIPYMSQEVNEKTVEHAAALMEQMNGLYSYIWSEAEKYYGRSVHKHKQGLVIEEGPYMHVPEVLKGYVIHMALSRAAGKKKDLESAHIKEIENLWKRQTGKQISLPYGILARRTYEGIFIGCPGGEEEKTWKQEIKAEYRVIECDGKPVAFPQTPYTKWFDYDIIKNSVIIRNRHAGDYITIDNKGNTQKIKNFFINQKIPKEQRDRIMLAADGNHIMWVIGYRQNQAYQVTEHTRRILELKIDRGEEYGRDS